MKHLTAIGERHLPGFSSLLASQVGFLLWGLCVQLLFLWFVVAFAKIRDWQELVNCFRLRLKDTSYGLAALCVGVSYALATDYLLKRHLVRTTFSIPVELRLSTLVAAFLEEPVARGYFFASLRSKWSLSTTVSWSIAFALITHLGLVVQSWANVIIMAIWTVIVCMFRERSQSLVPPILYHFGYNAAQVIVYW